MHRVSVLFDSFGPYHVARLRAASRVVELVGLEVKRHSQDYEWERAEAPLGFPSGLLAPAGTREELSRSKLCRSLEAFVSAKRPAAFAVPGWSSGAAFCAVQVCTAKSIPVIVMSDSNETDFGRCRANEVIKRAYVALCSSGLTSGMKGSQYLRALGMPPSAISQGFDVIDNEYFSQSTTALREAARCRNRSGLPAKYFLVTARFIPEKNLLRLLQAYARYRVLAAEAPAHRSTEALWSLVLLGDGPLKPDLYRLISGLSLQESVLLPGFKQYGELPTYYGLASAFVLPSVKDTWGLAVNEAMASGLPVVVSHRCGCASDLVQEGVNGFTFDPCNVEQLASLMVRLAAAPKPRLDEMGASSAKIIQNWGSDRFASGLKEAAEKAIEVGPKKAGLVSNALLWSLSRIRCG